MAGDLESELLQIMHDHHQTSIQSRDRIDKAKKEAMEAAGRVSDLLLNTLNSGIEESFINEKRIEREIRALVNTTARFTKQTNQWFASSEALNSMLKEIGDFENWMKVMDYDCKSINAALHSIHKN